MTRYLAILAIAIPAFAAQRVTVEPDNCTLRVLDGDRPGITVFIERDCRFLTKGEWHARTGLDTTKADTTRTK